MKEYKVIHPFDSWFYRMMFENGYSGVGNRTLNTTRCCQAFDRDVLDIDGTLPMDEKVFIVGREDRRILICFGNVKRGRLSSGGAGSQLRSITSISIAVSTIEHQTTRETTSSMKT